MDGGDGGDKRRWVAPDLQADLSASGERVRSMQVEEFLQEQVRVQKELLRDQAKEACRQIRAQADAFRRQHDPDGPR
ncbi:Uncharacterized protein PBTT_02264 [Plasmodiophora brassicae]